MESQNIWELISTAAARVLAIALLAPSISLITASECRGAENSHKARAGSSPGAIAQFMNGRLQLIYPNGRVREFESTAYYFDAARFSADGQAIVGHLGRDLLVLNQSLQTLWRIRPRQPNTWNLALSPSKTQVAFIGPSGQDQVTLGLITSSGEERTLVSFRRDSEDESRGLSWSPEGDRIVYGGEGHVKIIDVITMASETLGGASSLRGHRTVNGLHIGALTAELSCTTSRNASGLRWRGGRGSLRESTGRLTQNT